MGSRGELRRVFQAALEPVHGGRVVARALEEGPLPRRAPVRILAAGKAACVMAAAALDALPDRVSDCLVVTKEGHAVRLAGARVLSAAHPVPDTRSSLAGREALAFAEAASPQEILLVLLSGGASSLLSLPVDGLSLEDLAQATQALLRGGAGIHALNALRRHITRVGGGGLARASRARRVEVLALSDVADDDPATIASGPCAADPSDFADALQAAERFGGSALPERVRAVLQAGAAGKRSETAKPGDASLRRVHTRIIGCNADARRAAAAAAQQNGLAVTDLGLLLAGEARQMGARLARQACEATGSLDASLRGSRGPRGQLLLAGGETTVHVRGSGLGGRCQELALAAALALEGSSRITLLAAGTDGSDGPTQAAGAFADGASCSRARALGLDAAGALEENDSARFFEALGGQLITGPTGTNVMDLVLIHLAPTSC